MMDVMQPGESIVRSNLIATAVFLTVAIAASIIDGLRSLAIVVFLVLFASGVACFLTSYARAVERSRVDEIGTANLYLLTGSTATGPVKRAMLSALSVQIVASLAVTISGLRGLGESDANPLAFAVLVPMLGIGMNGLWASRHGRFGPRILSEQPTRRPSEPAPETEQEQNPHHD
jgi:hypothetical protein